MRQGLRLIALALALITPGCGSRSMKFAVGNTSCMAPTLKQGDLVKVVPFNGDPRSVRRYDIVIFRSPLDQHATWIMRVVGLPGEQIEITPTGLMIDGSEIEQQDLPEILRSRRWTSPSQGSPNANKLWHLGTNSVFVVGDNLEVANDSRYWGPLRTSSIVGVSGKKVPGTQVRITIP